MDFLQYVFFNKQSYLFITLVQVSKNSCIYKY